MRPSRHSWPFRRQDENHQWRGGGTPLFPLAGKEPLVPHSLVEVEFQFQGIFPREHWANHYNATLNVIGRTFPGNIPETKFPLQRFRNIFPYIIYSYGKQGHSENVMIPGVLTFSEYENFLSAPGKLFSAPPIFSLLLGRLGIYLGRYKNFREFFSPWVLRVGVTLLLLVLLFSLLLLYPYDPDCPSVCRLVCLSY